MGLCSAILLLPLAPVRGVTWVTERLVDVADQELRDPAVIHARLRALNEALERGEIDDEEFERDEERLLDLLEGHQRAPGTEEAPHSTDHDAERTRGT